MSSSSRSISTENRPNGRSTDISAGSEVVGVIGLGNVGHYYALNLLKATMEVVVRDCDSTKMQSLKAEGALPASSTAELASACDCVVLALPNPRIVQSEVYGEGGILKNARAGCLIIDISTIDPDTAVTLHSDCSRAGIRYLECPMSGGEPGGAGQEGARKGLVTFIVGGDKEVFEAAKPILNILGSYALFLGPAGTGNTVKLISNLIAGLNMAVMAEGFVLGAAAGISYEKLLEVFKHTDAKSYTMFEEFAPHLCANDYEGGFPVDLMHKDHRLVSELGRKYGVPLLFNQLALETYQIARAQGHGRKSHAVIVEVLATLAGFESFKKGPRAAGARTSRS